MTTKLIIGNKNYSSWSLRAWLLLAESGIDFEEQRIPMDTPAFKDGVQQVSPAGRVPVLVLDGQPVWDTLAIAETLAERWPEKGLWPDDAAARAHARSISAEMHSGFFTLRESMPMNCRAMGRKVHLPGDLTADIDRVIEIWADCQQRYVSDDGWLFGRFSIADAMYAPVVLRFRTYGINLPDAAQAYPDRLLESHAVQNWLAAAESETEVIEKEELGQ
jgi:glutathione S-transferase